MTFASMGVTWTALGYRVWPSHGPIIAEPPVGSLLSLARVDPVPQLSGFAREQRLVVLGEKL